MRQPDPTYNLSAFAERLFREKRMLPLAGKIRRSRDLHSLATDLTMALESLDALDALLATPTEANDHAKLITESALLNNAIILYVRATKTKSEERGGFDLRPRFDDAEKVAHKELSDLRDAAIAHFGSGGVYAGEWQSELVILQFNGEEAKPAASTRRQTVDRSLVQRTRRQVERAHYLLHHLYRDQLDEVADELSKAALADQSFLDEIAQHPLNLSLFLKSTQAADAARASFFSGYAKGSVNHR